MGILQKIYYISFNCMGTCKGMCEGGAGLRSLGLAASTSACWAILFVLCFLGEAEYDGNSALGPFIWRTGASVSAMAEHP